VTSIRRRLLVILLGLFLITWLALGAGSYVTTRHEVEELFDAELAQSARVLLALLQHEVEEDEEEFDFNAPTLIYPDKHPYEEKIAFQVWLGDKLVLRAPNAPTVHLATRLGHADQRLGDQHWRVFALVDPSGKVRLEVGERYDVRNEVVTEILWQLMLPLLLTLPLLVLLIRTGIVRGLRPLHRAAAEIADRSPRQLQPLALDDAPDEIKPLIRALNDLLARLAQALEGERRFTANAAHELRTPLAGLKAQAQVALRATDNEDRRLALAQIERGVDRATHLVAQLLTLARIDPEAASSRYEPVELIRLAAGVMAELAPAALDKHVELTLDEHERGVVRGDAAALAILLRNLLDNAIRYTPAGGQVAVGTRALADGVRLTVSDTGPGIPPAQRERAFDRFYRLPGTPDSGCGLGLSIVQRIVELHSARIALVSPESGSGLRVEIDFPAPVADAA
jgi:two-component system sensor histidine kinase QseC